MTVDCCRSDTKFELQTLENVLEKREIERFLKNVLFRKKKKDAAWDGFPFSLLKGCQNYLVSVAQEKSNQIGKWMKPGWNFKNILAPSYGI